MMRLVRLLVVFAGLSAVCCVVAPEFAVGQTSSKTTSAEQARTASPGNVPPASADIKADSEDPAESGAAHASNDSTSKKAATAKTRAGRQQRKTHDVAREQFRVEVALTGTFVAQETAEIAVRPEAWSEFKIKEIVEHGSVVQQDEVLVRFDNRRLEEAIHTLELDLHLADLAIRRAEEELPRQQKSLEMALADAERVSRLAREDYDRYKNLEESFFRKLVDYTVKGNEHELTYAREELDQLEKMYSADDLTEETEEIVLERQRNTVDMAQFYVEDAEFFRDGVLKITLPRMESRLKDALEVSEIDLERARMALHLDISRARYELEKMKQLHANARQRHAKLLSDRSLMEIKAPMGGIVYYGSCIEGRWVDMSSLIGKLRPHGTATANSVMMTIVQPRPLMVKAVVDEDDRPGMEAGNTATVLPPPKNSRKLNAQVSHVSVAPISTRRFGVELELTDADVPEWIVAGMTCKIRVVTYDEKQALVIPQEALHTRGDDQHYVWLMDADDNDADPVRQEVTVGRRNEDDVEILSGLDVGATVSLEDKDDSDDR